MTEVMHVETDVLVIGSGGAGMYAAIEAARSGAQVLLADRSLIGRGGATVMAQMTVAAALGSHVPDHWTYHLLDTLQAGRGLCDESLSRLLCEEGPTASARWMHGASAGPAKTAGSSPPRRPATIGRDAFMWIFSTPDLRYRKPCARSSTRRPASARPAISLSPIS